MTTCLLAENISAAELEDAISYRRPMIVNKIRLFVQNDAYAVCPRCKASLGREYMQFCDRCGQMLCWNHYNKAVVINKG